MCDSPSPSPSLPLFLSLSLSLSFLRYTYLNQRYGLKSLIIEHASAIIKGLNKFTEYVLTYEGPMKDL